jgi:hypothetical protein
MLISMPKGKSWYQDGFWLKALILLALRDYSATGAAKQPRIGRRAVRIGGKKREPVLVDSFILWSLHLPEKEYIKVYDQVNSVTAYSNFKEILRRLQNVYVMCCFERMLHFPFDVELFC